MAPLPFKQSPALPPCPCIGAGCGRPPFSPRPPLPLGYAPPTLSTNKDTLQWAAACGHLPTPVTSGIPVYSGFLDDPQRAIVDDGRHCAASVCGHFASRFDCVFLGRASRQTHGAWHGTRPYPSPQNGLHPTQVAALKSDAAPGSSFVKRPGPRMGSGSWAGLWRFCQWSDFVN